MDVSSSVIKAMTTRPEALERFTRVTDEKIQVWVSNPNFFYGSDDCDGTDSAICVEVPKQEAEVYAKAHNVSVKAAARAIGESYFTEG